MYHYLVQLYIVHTIPIPIHFRNAKRLPLKPSWTGMFLQALMAVSLFFPKVAVISLALVHVPYLYPVALAVEYLLILCYNRIFFKCFGGEFTYFYF